MVKAATALIGKKYNLHWAGANPGPYLLEVKMEITENRNVRKQFILTKTMATKLKMVADLRHESQNEIVMKALHSYLIRYDGKLKSMEEAADA